MLTNATKANVLASIVRTAVPALVGWLLSLAVVGHVLGWFSIDDVTARRAAATATTAVLTVAYYVVIRLFELYVQPKLGWLLGWAAAPRYEAPGVATSGYPEPMNDVDQADHGEPAGLDDDTVDDDLPLDR